MDNEIRYILRLISEHALDLNGLTVITEIASGNYLYTPFIAALAGCKQVFAVAKNNRYGTASSSINKGKELAQALQLNSICFAEECTNDMLGAADIITNMGAVRPLDASKIRCMSHAAVIPYMFETWEYRKEDLDLEACKKYGILTMGTNENYSSLRLIEQTNKLTLMKVLLDNGFSLYDDRYLLISIDPTMTPLVSFFKQNGIRFDVLDVNQPDAAHLETIKENIGNYDAIIIFDLSFKQEIIGDNGLLPLQIFLAADTEVPVIHFAGRVSKEALLLPSLNWIPNSIAKPGYMSISIDILGFKPCIKLLFAGMKTGEMMARLRKSGMSCSSIVQAQTDDSLLQVFPKELLTYAD